VGVFFPRRWYDRASDTPVVTSWFILTPHSPSRVLQSSRTPLRPFWGRIGYVRVGGCGDYQDHR